MKVSREQARQVVVAHVKQALGPDFPDSRAKYPGTGPVDFTNNNAPYVNVDMIYMDGEDTGIGKDVNMRLMGTIVVEFNYKEGNGKDLKKVNEALDRVQLAVSGTDAMFPVRTYASRPHTPTKGADKGWVREGIVTPFWFDTSRS